MDSIVGIELIKLLGAAGVDTVFGIPGVHTVELYRGLAGSTIRHITPRHEQGAGFMADGYARVSGMPGVCFVITGPGLTNAATAMAQAYSDSVPMLVISSVNPARAPDKAEGRLHEMPDQSGFARRVSAQTVTVRDADALPSVIEDVFREFKSARPRPRHLQLSTDLLGQRTKRWDLSSMFGAPPDIVRPDHEALNKARRLLSTAKRPIIIAGGGTVDAAISLQRLAEKLDAPVVTTLAAKGVLADDHPLCVGARLGFEALREEVATADVVLVAGSEIAPTDLWPHESLSIHGSLIRIDIDARHFAFDPQPTVALHGDSDLTLRLLDEELVNGRESQDLGSRRTVQLRELVQFDQYFERWLQPLRNALPRDTVITADSTQIVYQGGASFPMYSPRSWLTSVTGFGTLGYALPAAIGAKLQIDSRTDQRSRDRRVVCMIGDGGFQFTLPELMTASQNDVPIDVIVWNNQGYGEIRDTMTRAGVEPEGVDVATPDVVALAKAMRVQAHRVDSPEALAAALTPPTKRPRVIDVTLAPH